MKRLISWLALSNDFNKGKVNTTGVTYSFHKHYFNYEIHTILYTTETKLQVEFLKNKLAIDFPKHNIETLAVNISDISNLQEVKTKVESILLSFSDDKIDIFFSPGSSIMQVSWYICHTTLGLNTRLLQLLRFEHSKSKNKPDLVYIDSEYSDLPRSAIIKQKFIEKRVKYDNNFLLTESIKPVYKKAEQIAQTDNVGVHITGETGTGKEHLAKYIHKQSARKNKAFEAINCSGFSDQLLESQLFGHEKGAFTGAINSGKGIFMKANGGTVFLDEIADITPYMQQVLLRVLQEKEIRPIGGNVKKIDVRIISASNKNLLDLVAKGKFRSDLFYRLTVTDLYLPSLQERGLNDKLLMINYFTEIKQKQFSKTKALEYSKELLEFLKTYSFPGNIRELENLIERFYVFCTNIVEIDDLPMHLLNKNNITGFNLEKIKKVHILKVFNYFNENKKQTAKALGISLNTLKKYIS